MVLTRLLAELEADLAEEEQGGAKRKSRRRNLRKRRDNYIGRLVAIGGTYSPYVAVPSL
jgi:hypothetical protein